MAKLDKKGYGQVEPNHLAAQKSGAIYAQLPAASSISVVENGMFMKYDYAAGECNLNGNGEDMLVFSEVKLYDPTHSYKDFALKTADSVDGKIYPRLMLTFPGDHFTTNLVDLTSEAGSRKGKFLTVQNGILTEQLSDPGTGMTWQVVMETTLADGQPAVKVIRVR
ncbi:MAG: hypothetical protein MSA56_14630 [Clostridium sp.]|nr:hypothetical protein [Clostridium sp.]